MTARRCQVNGHPLFTASSLFYVGLQHGSDVSRYRLRFCRIHAASIHEDLAQFEVDADDGTLRGGDLVSSQCFSCGQPVDELGWYVFMTGYPTKDQRKDYWSRLHVECSIGDLLGKGEYAE